MSDDKKAADQKEAERQERTVESRPGGPGIRTTGVGSRRASAPGQSRAPGQQFDDPAKQARYDADEADVQRQLDEIAEREAGDIPAPDGDRVGNTMSRQRADEHERSTR